MWSLTDDQLLMLDGHADEKMQAVIDGIKFARANGASLPLIGKIIADAKAAGWIRIRHSNGRFCGVCGKSAGYATYPRSGRYHRKGQKNWDRPLTMPGVCFDTSCVTFKDSINCCNECDKVNGISETLVELIVSKELPIEIKGSKESLFSLDTERKCFQCKETIYESEMGKMMTLMGDGYYPGKCPKCGAESLPFGMNHCLTGGFRMVRKPDLILTTSEGV